VELIWIVLSIALMIGITQKIIGWIGVRILHREIYFPLNVNT
jgi:hypothetical protein